MSNCSNTRLLIAILNFATTEYPTTVQNMPTHGMRFLGISDQSCLNRFSNIRNKQVMPNKLPTATYGSSIYPLTKNWTSNKLNFGPKTFNDETEKIGLQQANKIEISKFPTSTRQTHNFKRRDPSQVRLLFKRSRQYAAQFRLQSTGQ